jgi:hypothetical protein
VVHRSAQGYSGGEQRPAKATRHYRQENQAQLKPFVFAGEARTSLSAIPIDTI